ncbi:hypothetical protein Q5424_08375 [Conexibacter sp. JD483]|uniref:hypothetical protein n=1 Tax=unclassified Conexibacter TaxID=2627773 RepID=UPI00271B30FD|nr:MULTISPECIES: hypothetical protein [unclassified Conexibacter]MDO8183946.1 hypothetical protein [Conexibacter sp. CPCC 205706]MDO8196938.1 hypothetical protein [Conexibacter sp. CPCC 205762]MDR9369092.1 hypothetical protein [Conexibacter sp. JD483]
MSRPQLFTVLGALRDAVEQLSDLVAADGYADAFDAGAATIAATHLAELVEQLSFPVERVGQRMGEIALGYRDALDEDDLARSRYDVTIALEGAARSLDRAQTVLAAAAAMTGPSDELVGLTRDPVLVVRAPTTPPRWIEASAEAGGQAGVVTVREVTPARGEPDAVTVDVGEPLLELLQTKLAITHADAVELQAEIVGRLLERLLARTDLGLDEHTPVSAPSAQAAPAPARSVLPPVQRRVDDALVALLAHGAERTDPHYYQPPAIGLANALLAAAGQHPDGVAGLISHRDDDPHALSLVRDLLTLARRARRPDPDHPVLEPNTFVWAYGWAREEAERSLRQMIDRVDDVTELPAATRDALRDAPRRALRALTPIATPLKTLEHTTHNQDDEPESRDEPRA